MNNIILTGFMGTGKTTVGRVIGRKIGFRFIDTDRVIEDRCGMPIKSIFELKGEEYFRNIEKAVVAEVAMSRKAVIACGGGVVKSEESVSMLKANGIIICLTADIDTIMERIGRNAKRPLAEGKSREDILNMLKDREQYYSIADAFIDTSNDSPFIIADKVIEVYKTYNKI